jgi:hypothetical protein
MHERGSRHGRAIAAIAMCAVVVMIVAGCSSGGSATSDGARPSPATAHAKPVSAHALVVAAQRKIVQHQSLVARDRKRLVAAIRRRWQQDGIPGSTVARRTTPRGGTATQQVVEVSSAGGRLCGAGKGKTQQQRLALYYLNLSCGK